MSYAHALKALGQQPEALREYRAAIALKPEFGEVYWSMANLKVFRFEPAEVAAMEEQLKREDLSRERRHPFPLRARQGLRGRRRLRPRLGALSRRQPAPAAAGVLRPGGLRGAPRGDRGGLQPRVPRAARGRGIRVGRADLHRRPAALGLDADRADPREPQPGGGHARAADARRNRVLDRALPPRQPRVSGGRPRAARPRLPRLRPAVHRGDADLPDDRQAALHGQAAEQLLAHRLRAPDPAERDGSSTRGATRSTASSAATSSSSARARTSPTT